MELHFEKLKLEHLDEVMEIENKSFPQPWTRGMFEREICLSISKFFVAKYENKIAGYGGYWWVSDEAHVVNLAVHPDLRRKGVGERILGHMTAHMKGQAIKTILLEVRKSNLSAQKLYENKGFKVSGIRKKYYADEDAILMESSIESI